MMAASNTRTKAGRPRPPVSSSARGAKKARQSKRPPRDGDFESLVDSIGAIARRLGDLNAQARALGVFTADRDLLTCPKCGLMEDVLIDGRLVTYHEGGVPGESGLRFVVLDELHTYRGRQGADVALLVRRVREAADARGSYSVKALLPADVIGLFVLLPRVD